MQQTQVTSVLSEPQRALLSTISAGHQVITTVEKELVSRVSIPELGTDPVSYIYLDTLSCICEKYIFNFIDIIL